MDESERVARVRRVLGVALALNVGVAVAKIVYGSMAHSLAIEADGYHSFTDGLSTVVALVGIGLARRPPDADHPYGHRKFEILAASLIGVSLLLLATRIGADIMTHVRDGDHHRPEIGWPAFVILSVTLLVNLGISMYQLRQGRLLSSPLLTSDGKHTRADCYVTGAILVTTLASWYGRPDLDIPAAAAVAGLIAVSGFGILAENARYLTDVALIEPTRIRAIACRLPEVADAYGIRTRGTPDAIFIDLRVRVAGHLRVSEAARVNELLTEAIRAEIGTVVDVTIVTEAKEET
ncbi:MAG TPA: cation diffusion facilitator family transporter [Polyangiaceae bacterium]|jgi:cation diffusion facilitator family transporter|nr:cation diffusion facilitator family transporter [Polyangiaceae bacterium]